MEYSIIITTAVVINAGDGVEPVREYKSRRILSPVRLPIPPRRQISGTNRARTYDPLLVRQMLSQLSYDPKILIYKLFTNKTTRMGFEPTTSAVTGRRSNQLSHQAIYIVDFSGPSGTRTQDRPVMSRLL